MAFFGLSDITISQEENRAGPLASLYAEVADKTGKLSKTFRYPLDVGNYDKGHYMIFHIFQQKNSQFQGVQRSPEKEIMKNYKGASKPSTSFASQINSKIDAAVNSFTKGKTLFGKEISTSFGTSSASVSQQSFSKDEYVSSVKDIENKSLLDTTKVTSDSIVLYMPDTVQFSSTQGYENLDLGGIAGQAGKIGASILKGEDVNIGGAIVAAAVNASIKKAGELANSGDAAKAAAFLATGGVVNPQLELLYTAPNFRSFNYEFMFYPRSEQEALEVQNIIERFRFHQAPELDKTTANVLLIPPSEFEIMFFYNGRKNPNIPNMTRCVLESIDVNYAPNGWSAYEMPGESTPAMGRTGMPTAIQLTLGFKETQFLTKRDFRTFASDNKK